jgi:hypothetical protein
MEFGDQAMTFSDLRALPDDWADDGGYGPAPAEEAIARAEAIAAEAASVGLAVDDIDADVLGGVSLMFFGASGERSSACLWVSVLNGRPAAFLLSVSGRGAESIDCDWARVKGVLGR